MVNLFEADGVCFEYIADIFAKTNTEKCIFNISSWQLRIPCYDQTWIFWTNLQNPESSFLCRVWWSQLSNPWFQDPPPELFHYNKDLVIADTRSRIVNTKLYSFLDISPAVINIKNLNDADLVISGLSMKEWGTDARDRLCVAGELSGLDKEELSSWMPRRLRGWMLP